MKRKIILLGICIMLFIPFVEAQSSTFFKSYKIYTHSDFEYTSELILTYDSDYVIAFNSFDSTLNEYTVELIKFDSAGNHLWHYSFPSTEEVYDTKIAQCPDSGFIISSTYNLPTDTTQKIILIKTDNNGNEEWVRLLGDRTISQQNWDLSVSENCIFVLSSGTIKLSDSTNQEDYFVAKIEMSGNVIWYNKYNFIGNPFYCTFVITHKNEIFVSVENFPSGPEQFGLSKIDSNGNLSWSKIYPVIDMAPLKMIQNSQGDLILTGHAWTTTINEWDIFLMGMDTLGNFKWGKTYGGASFDEGWFVFQVKSGYVICAEPESFGDISLASLIKTDSIGNLQWMKLYGDTGSFPNGAVQLNNGFVIYGINGSYGSYAPIYLVRTDTNGITKCESTSATFPDSSFTLTPTDTGTSGVVHGDSVFYLSENADSLTESNNCIETSVKSFLNNPDDIILYPNPNNGNFTFVLNLSNPNPLIEIYSILGNRVYYETLRSAQGDNLINLTAQPNGVYFYRVLSENGALIGEGEGNNSEMSIFVRPK